MSTNPVPVTIGVRPPEVPAGTDPRRGSALVDSFGRVHRDLRISLTDRCSLRCTYCMPEQGMEWLARSSILSVDEIVRVAGICAEAGISTFRLTGGEPLLRRDIVDVVGRLASLRTGEGEPVQVAMTTNGIGLPRVLDSLVEAGLARLNISLDTVRADRFAELTRRNRFDDVMAGIAAAQASGLRPLKLNAVAMRGVNEDELVDLVEFAIAHDAQMRFIEQMPLDAGHTWDRNQMVTREEILDALGQRWQLRPVPGRGGAPAERWYLGDTNHQVGVIASVTAPFCGACDRLRLTADGQLRNCLFSTSEYDLLPVLRPDEPQANGATPTDRRSISTREGHVEADVDAHIDAVLRACIDAKKPGHGIDEPGFLQPARGMNAIGG